MTRRVVVGPTPGSRLVGDEPIVVDLDASVPQTSNDDDPTAFAGTIRRDPVSRVSVVEVVVDGWRFELEVEDAHRAALRRRATREPDAAATSGPSEIRAIIPGRVATVRVAVGDVVEVGQGLLVVEAMKMQNELKAGRSGTIERVAVVDGQTIDNGDLLVVIG